MNSAGEMHPSAETIAARTSLSERTVRTHLDTLVDHGYLELVRQGGTKGGPRTSEWRYLTPAAVAEVADSTPAAVAEVADSTPAAVAVTSAAPSVTPAAPAPELDELGELGETRARDDLDAAAAELVEREAHEVVARLRELRDELGVGRVDQVLEQLTSEPAVRFEFASKLAAHVRRRAVALPRPVRTFDDRGPAEVRTQLDERGVERIFATPRAS